MQRFTRVPLDLYRIQNAVTVKLHNKVLQDRLGRTAYDFIPQEGGLILPVKGDTFERPNGMSLRPLSAFLHEMVAKYRGNVLYVLPKGLEIPSHLVLYLEHTTHYSLQTAVPIRPADLDKALTEFFSSLERIDKQEFFRRFPDVSKLG